MIDLSSPEAPRWSLRALVIASIIAAGLGAGRTAFAQAGRKSGERAERAERRE